MMWTIERYTPDKATEWDQFILESRNGTFLFQRPFMDYHSDRFTDCSLLAFRKGKLRAVLPADIKGDQLRSHGGLTYGGWVLPTSTGINGAEELELWRVWMEWCKKNSINRVLYKPIPYIYPLQPSGEDEYCLFRTHAILKEVNISTTIRLTQNPGLNKLQRRHLKTIEKDSFTIKTYRGNIPENSLKSFYEMLEKCLWERHDTKAVHSLDEISLLSERFPENISLNLIENNGKPEAGIWMFETPVCNHCQYIATTPEGRANNLLTPLTIYLIDQATKCGKSYFDFGTSTEDQGKKLNSGLHRHKSSFGGTGVCLYHWEIEIAKALSAL